MGPRGWPSGQNNNESKLGMMSHILLECENFRARVYNMQPKNKQRVLCFDYICRNRGNLNYLEKCRQGIHKTFIDVDPNDYCMW